VTFYPDVLPKLLTEIRDDADVAAITSRIRGAEPADGDAQGAGSYQPFVVLVQLAAPRMPRVPVQTARIVARCYGRTPAEAAALRWAVSNAIHNRGPRVFSNGLGFYNSLETEGGEQDKDPDTQQPLQIAFFEVPATTQVVA
jgi:hypothetical protein